jgi:hypothetical protein
VPVRAAKDVELDSRGARVPGDLLPSGEWAENFSLLNYEDLTKHYEPTLFKPEVRYVFRIGVVFLSFFCVDFFFLL